MYYSLDDVKKLGSIMGIWAHPDDESWTSAGLMKMAAKNGQKITIITATKGGAGQTADEKRWPRDNLREIRPKELTDCLCNIGEVNQYWLGHNDGKLHESEHLKSVNEIAQIIDENKPDTIVTFEKNGITGHSDHKKIHVWAIEAAEQSSFSGVVLCAIESQEKYESAGKLLDGEFNVFFNVDKPNLIREDEVDVCIKLAPDILYCKLCCLKAHESQTAHMFESEKGRKSLEILATTECFSTI